MNRKVNGSILAGALLGAVIANADIVVDNFLNVQGLNQLGGNWLADSDAWIAIGGSSKVTPAGDTVDLVQGEGCGSGCYAGHNIFKAYVEDPATAETMISSDIKVTGDVSAEKKWAYAGWVMNFVAERGKDGKQPWELLPHEKGNIVDISTCDALEIQLQFDLDRQLWIALYNPIIEKDKPTSPQYGWRYKGSGNMDTKKFSLKSGGLSGIGTKWADPAAAPLDLKQVTRLQIFYEGQKGLSPAEPAPYDDVAHRLTIRKVQLNGAACKVVGTDSLGNVKEFGTVGIKNGVASKLNNALELNVAAGRIQFVKAAEMGLKVTVRDMAGHIVARGDVNAANTSMDVSGLRTGVYHVQAAAGTKTYSNTVTLLK